MTPRPHRLRAGAAALMVVTVGGCATHQGNSSNGSNGTDGGSASSVGRPPGSTSTATTSPVGAPSDIADPAHPRAVAAAQTYLRRRLAASWRDTTPAAFVPAVRDLVTPGLAARLRRYQTRGQVGQAWIDFRDRHGVSTVTAVTAQVPPDIATRQSATRLVMQAAGTVHTVQDGAAPTDRPFAVNLTLVPAPAGTTWLVEDEEQLQ